MTTQFLKKIEDEKSPPRPSSLISKLCDCIGRPDNLEYLVIMVNFRGNLLTQNLLSHI